MTHRMFPILGDENVKSVAWDLLEPHRERAKTNHGQTLEQLANRGGLSLAEVVAIVSDRRWQGLFELRK